MKVFIMNNYQFYADWLGTDIELVENIKDAELVIFTGGGDVHPVLYGEQSVHHLTQVDAHRDNVEIALYNKVREYNIPVLGICRGAQFITVMNSGKLVQHVNGHGRSDGHEIKTKDGEIYFITSTHHQMMYPYTAKEYEIIAVSATRLSDVYFKNKIDIYTMPEEPEIVYYPITNCLCVQGHPEIMGRNEPVLPYLRKLIKDKLNVRF